jgi:CcmD family protein
VTPAEKYVAAAYAFVFLVVLGYVLIIGTKLARLEREVAELAELARDRPKEPERKAVAVG